MEAHQAPAMLEAEPAGSGRFDPVDVEDLIGEVLPSVREAARRAGVRLFVAGRGERTVVGATHGRLAEAITAVVLAAIERCDRGGGMRISWNRTSAPRASIVIGCTGVAPPGVTADAFEDRPGSDGNSLRSALADVRALEGDVLFEPSATGGTLTVDLPACGVAATKRPSELRQRRAYPTLDRPDDPCTVVYVEDNVSNRALVHNALGERDGVTLVSATSGRDGIELIKGCIPDLVLLDLDLPDMNGHDVLKECLASPDTSQIPVVIVSADASPSMSRSLIASGASAFVTKPLDIPKFLEVIDATLRRVIDARSSVTPIASIRVAAGDE